MVGSSKPSLPLRLEPHLFPTPFAYLVADTGEKIVIEERGDERVREGQRVGLKFDATRLYLFDAETELRMRA